MQLSEINVHLCPPAHGRLKAFCSITFADAIVVHDVKLIDGDGGLFVAMPSRKLADHCRRCNEKNHLRARFCNGCGQRLNEARHHRYRLDADRLKLHADIAHPISADARFDLQQQIIAAYEQEVRRSYEPGYMPTTGHLDLPDMPAMQQTG